jgi:hypothetical protein
MGPDVLPGDVRDKDTITVRFAVENQCPLPALLGRSEALAPEKQSEFQRHVEPGKARYRIERGRRQIVDSEPALLDDAFNLRQPKFPGVVLFKGTARDKSEVIDTEDNRVEYWSVRGIERAIDENVVTF